MAERYTHMQHNIRKHFGLTMEQYAVLDAIYCLSRNQPCIADFKYYVDLFDISERTYYNIIKKLKEKQLIEKYKTGLRTTKVWDEAMKDRIAPWTDPSEKPAEPAPEPPDQETEEPVTVELAVCLECAKSLQNMQSVTLNTAKIAVKNCKICSTALQKLQKTTAKIAVINIVINTVIDTDNNNALPPVSGTLTPHQAIIKIFRDGSVRLVEQGLAQAPFSVNAREAAAVKLLEPKLEDDPESFAAVVKHFLTIKIYAPEGEFLKNIEFAPSKLEHFWTAIAQYQFPADIRERVRRSCQTEEERLLQEYGSLNDGKLKYLVQVKHLTQEQYDYISKHRLEVPA